VDIAARRTEDTLQALEDEEGIAWPRGQPVLVNRNNKSTANRTRPTGGLAKLTTMQVYLIMQAARYNMEPPSLPTQPAPAPESNEAAVEDRREAILPPLQIAHQAIQAITQRDMEVQGSVADETEACVSTADDAPSISTIDSLNESQSTNRKRPK
jgi:hypothetical protein